MRKKRLKRLYDVRVGKGGSAICLGDSDLASDAEQGVLTSPIENELFTFPMPILFDISTINKDGYMEISESRLRAMDALEADCFFLIPNPLDNEVRRNGKAPYLIVFAKCDKYKQESYWID